MTVVIGERLCKAALMVLLTLTTACYARGQTTIPQGVANQRANQSAEAPLVDQPPETQSPAISPKSSLPPGPAEALYLRLGSVGLDPARVFRLRDAELDRPGFHLTLEDGTIGFTEDVLGHVTGAFFEGEGEVLVVPPDRAERASLALFTGTPILEEKFTSAYFRFNDGTYEEMQPFMRPPEDAPAFVARCGPAAVRLAHSDSLRLLTTFALMLPESSARTSTKSDVPDRMLHARLQGEKLGGFDLIYDSQADEQVEVLQLARAHGANYYDIWMSFNPRLANTKLANFRQGYTAIQPAQKASFEIPKYKIEASVTPPLRLDAEATLDLHILGDGQRALLFELSRYLQISQVEADGKPVEFIHNPALEGSQLERNGNDLVAVIFPRTLQVGEHVALRFVYGGEVLQEEANGLLYVGARGTWYPNRGLKVADFDLVFNYPADWTLLATGKRVSFDPNKEQSDGEAVPLQKAHWISERPIPVAGFNLGRYVQATALADGVPVEAYATREVERTFPKPQDPIAQGGGKTPRPLPDISLVPSPARNVQEVADKAAAAMSFFAKSFGPYPYGSLALTQIPGATSQGWPGLVFLSSYAFLTTGERATLNFRPADAFLAGQTPAHETAHQWWGDLVAWSTYRDQWISEGLANYSSLMLLETQNPDAFRIVMEKYRDDLLDKKDDRPTWQAGPVTLGQRLNSSRFARGYEAISYGRGTWLFHMLRQMLRDAEMVDMKSGVQGKDGESPDELFTRILRRVQTKYAGREISTRELLAEFEEQWPKSLRFEGKPSLDWFWDGWLQGTAIPKIEFKNFRVTRADGESLAVGIIEQREAPDDLVTSVPIYAAVPGKAPELVGQVFADGAETSFRLRVPSGTRALLLDPERTILRRR